MFKSPGITSTVTRRIAVLIDPGDSWGRRLILGISGAIRHLLPWDLLIAPQDDQWRLRVPSNWKGDGVIAAVRDDKTAEHVRSLRLPAVHVSLCEKSKESRYRVITDDRKRAEMGFQHFQERGFQHYAYYGPRSQRYPESRGEMFRDVVSEAGFSCNLFQVSSHRKDANAVRQQAADWLQHLPRPVAIFAADPHPALQLTEICQANGISIPEEVAVLAGDTDDVLCNIATPPLSSILLGCEQIGSQAVQMLKVLLEGGTPQPPFQVIPPICVQHRQSTDVLANDDPVFVAALRFIRENAHRGIQVGDLLQVIPVSRRLLEQRFQHYLHRSPADEIRKVRLERVRQLLVETDQSIAKIASVSGFSSASQLGVVFHRATGLTPMEYRKSNRRRSSL